jgi:diguanylate cyclase
MSTTSAPTDPYAVARSALTLVGKFKTPPTPPIYEVWYRYVEASDRHIVEALEHAVEYSRDISLEMLSAIHQAHCEPADEATAHAADELLREIEKFGRVVEDQRQAGSEFDQSIESAVADLEAEETTRVTLERCVGQLAASSAAMHARLQQVAAALEETQSQVNSLKDELEQTRRAALTDHLTSIANRKQYDAWAEKHVSSGPPAEGQLYLALSDLDHFKKINDQFGHAVGDMVLCFTARIISEVLPNSQHARLGGDEFAIFFTANSREEAEAKLGQLHERAGSRPLAFGEEKREIGHLKISLGATHLRPDDDPQSWFRRADRLLYSAKELGRNQVVIDRF